jgi:hypothetical protein
VTPQPASRQPQNTPPRDERRRRLFDLWDAVEAKKRERKTAS